ncbi:S41 family peptidase [Lewinella sp. IMCC34191]|uniref:S41 family peptidase n=1 Tax=Lewinella sp. IMCC34191 TaxID=2259172 RepID=UPI000E2367DB|nr:S41 family peptidase [Lewinella sp. IMCC34191]
MRYLIPLFLLCVFVQSCAVRHSPPPPAQSPAAAYLDEFFTVVSRLALDHERFDWVALRQRADSLARGATTTSETYPALRDILGRVNRHSFLMDPGRTERWQSGGGDEEAAGGIQDISQATGHVISPEVSYVSVPMVHTGHGPTMQHFADSLQSLIARLDGPNTTGWVVDLRGNGGGNCWPMLTGLGPILGEGTAGYFMDRDGRHADSWGYRKGASVQKGRRMVEVSGTPYQLHHPHPRVAVLTDGRTGSSGEVVTVSFRGRPDTRSFGTATAGYSTTNFTHYMSDGALLNLTVSVYGDRKKHAYGKEIVPDVVTEDPLAEAKAWLDAMQQSGK